ncbi:MAG: hypothetical protein ABFD49_04110 [Armatimonadota bacterium]|nr:hypothetical protein [bacterium]
MEMIKKQITLSDGRTLIYFSFPEKNEKQTCKCESSPEPKRCCGGDKQ